MDEVQSDQGWTVELINAFRDALTYLVDLFLKGDVGDVRYWVLVVMMLSVIWGPVAWYFIRRKKNGT